MPARAGRCGGGWIILGVRGIGWLVVGLLAGVALAGVGLAVAGRADSAAFAQVRAGQALGEGVIVSATPLGDNEVVICLVDTLRQRMAVYLADGRRSRLRLLAVRDLSADWSLSDYNNDPPLPKDIRARAEKASEAGRAAPGADSRKPETAP